MRDYNYYLTQSGEYGEVTKINYPIITAMGLPYGKLDELVIFETGERGQIIGLEEDEVQILLFSHTRIKQGTKLSRSDTRLEIPVGEELLGKALTPFCQPLSGNDILPNLGETREVDIQPSGISHRKKITHQLETGTAVIDLMVPLGKGQKELILGDRKTGKSTFVLSAITNQIRQGAIAIYAAIGKKKSDIKYLETFMQEHPDLKKNMILIATSSFDSPGLIFMTPFTAMTIAEYFRDQGREVIVVMDDLLTHAKFYREFALLAQTFPGRDSYPGDIFHIHAKLLERAGNFTHEQNGEASISCLPIAETQDGDITSYIVSNLMSITDGHIFFDNNIFNQGRRPAINIPLSVTRVGKQTQDKIGKDINRELNSLFAIYDKSENLSHFGSEMTESVKSILGPGERVYHFFNQPPRLTLPREIYLTLFALVWTTIINDDDTIDSARTNLLQSCQQESNRMLIKSLLNTDSLNAYLKNIRDNAALLEPLWKQK